MILFLAITEDWMFESQRAATRPKVHGRQMHIEVSREFQA